MIDYAGDDILIEEMPQGCVVTYQKFDGSTVEIVISSFNAAIALRKSLRKLIETWFPDKEVNWCECGCPACQACDPELD